MLFLLPDGPSQLVLFRLLFLVDIVLAQKMGFEGLSPLEFLPAVGTWVNSLVLVFDMLGGKFFAYCDLLADSAFEVIS